MQVVAQKVAGLGKIKYNTLIINGAPFLADYIPSLNRYRWLDSDYTVSYNFNCMPGLYQGRWQAGCNKNTPPKVM